MRRWRATSSMTVTERLARSAFASVRLVGRQQLDGGEQAGAAHLVFEHTVSGAAIGRGGDARPVLPELPGVASRSGHRHPSDDEPAADSARTAVEVHDVADPARRAEEVLGHGAEHRVVARGGRQPGRGERPGRGRARRSSGGAGRCGRVRPRRARVRELRGRCPRCGRRRVRPASTGRAARRSSPRSPPGVISRSTSMRTRTGMRRSRPTAAIVRASTSGLAAIATTEGSTDTTGDGRPTRRAGSGARSCTRRSRTSSATRSAIVDRFSPVASVSAARESGPSRCTSRSTRPRLRRRTLSPPVHSAGALLRSITPLTVGGRRLLLAATPIESRESRPDPLDSASDLR